MIQNIVVGNILCDPSLLFADDIKDWEENERKMTLFTETRFLPAVLKEAGIVSSTSEVRRNRPDLVRTLDTIDFFQIKLGKKIVFIAVGN